MKRIKETLGNLLVFFSVSRGSGTTTLLKKVASENDVWVLTQSIEVAEEDFGDKGVSIFNTERLRLIDATPKPILVDNYVLIDILGNTLEQFKQYELKIASLERENAKLSAIAYPNNFLDF